MRDIAAVEPMIFDLENKKKVTPKKLAKNNTENYKVVNDKKVDPLKVIRVSDGD